MDNKKEKDFSNSKVKSISNMNQDDINLKKSKEEELVFKDVKKRANIVKEIKVQPEKNEKLQRSASVKCNNIKNNEKSNAFIIVIYFPPKNESITLLNV